MDIDSDDNFTIRSFNLDGTPVNYGKINTKNDISKDLKELSDSLEVFSDPTIMNDLMENISSIKGEGTINLALSLKEGLRDIISISENSLIQVNVTSETDWKVLFNLLGKVSDSNWNASFVLDPKNAEEPANFEGSIDGTGNYSKITSFTDAFAKKLEDDGTDLQDFVLSLTAMTTGCNFSVVAENEDHSINLVFNTKQSIQVDIKPDEFYFNVDAVIAIDFTCDDVSLKCSIPNLKMNKRVSMEQLENSEIATVQDLYDLFGVNDFTLNLNINGHNYTKTDVENALSLLV